MALKSIYIGSSVLWLLASSYTMPALAEQSADNPLQLRAASTVTLVVADVNKEIDWWQNVLGFRETKRAEGPPSAPRSDGMRRVELAGYRVDLVWHKGSTRPPPPALYHEGYSHISFTVDSKAIDEDYKWLMAHDVKIDAVRDKTTNALRIMRFHDPEGNEIHIELPN